MAMVGPSHLGKKSFVLFELQSHLSDTDILAVDRSIAGAREAASFCLTAPIFSPVKVVLIDSADELSEPAQDAYLKLCEETPPNICIIMIMEDNERLFPSLQSRIRKTIKWYPISLNEMHEFADSIHIENQLFLSACSGRPGLYQLLCDYNEELSSLYKVTTEIMTGVVNPAIVSTPKFILDLPNKPDPAREAASVICSFAAREALKQSGSYKIAAAFLHFSSLLVKMPNTNAEIYWQKICSSSM